jgi:hypothetical protein
MASPRPQIGAGEYRKWSQSAADKVKAYQSPNDCFWRKAAIRRKTDFS